MMHHTAAAAPKKEAEDIYFTYQLAFFKIFELGPTRRFILPLIPLQSTWHVFTAACILPGSRSPVFHRAPLFHALHRDAAAVGRRRQNHP